MKRGICAAATLCSAFLMLMAFKSPRFYTKYTAPKSTAEKLDFVVFSINAEQKIVKSDEILEFVIGDVVVVEKAVLRNARTAELSNVVGFSADKSQDLDDTKVLIDTRVKLLDPTWAVNPEGDTYAVVSSSGDVIHGKTYLRRIKPMLKYADILINDQLRVVRESEELAVAASDLIKVQKVVTNLKTPESVEFEIVSPTGEKAQDGEFAIQFKRFNYIFATVPLRVSPL